MNHGTPGSHAPWGSFCKNMIYTYFDENEKKYIEVPIERWVWGVVYRDGSELHQFGNDGKFHRIGEVKQEEVTMATIYRYDNMKKRIDIPFREGMKLIHKYRMVKPGAYDSVNAGPNGFVRCYMFGYKYGGAHSYNFILPDDRIVTSPCDDVDLTKFEI